MNIVEKCLSWQVRGYYKIPHLILAFLGLEIPKEVVFPDIKLGGVHFVHRAPGTVIHPKTTFGKGVQIYQNVTIGKKRPWDATVKEGGAYISDGAILCAGAKILFGEETLIVGRGTIVGANSVLTKSTGENEIWAGIPARRVSSRNDGDSK